MRKIQFPRTGLRGLVWGVLCVATGAYGTVPVCPFADMASALGAHPFQAQIDAHVTAAFNEIAARSQQLEAGIRADAAAGHPQVLDMVVIGAGNQSAQFLEGYLAERPGARTMIFERTNELGLFHRLAGSFDINTPESPGASGNPFPGMPIQTRHLHHTGEQYPNASLLGNLTVLAHHYLRSNIVLGQNAMPVEVMPPGANWPARYRVRTASGLIVYTHAVTLATGMGTPRTRHLAPECVHLIQSEEAGNAAGWRSGDTRFAPGIQDSDQFLQHAAADRRAGRDPMARYGDGVIAFIGAQHGGFTAVEAVTGLNPTLNPGGQPNRRNRILWFNQRATTATEFQAQFPPAPADPTRQSLGARYDRLAQIFGWTVPFTSDPVVTPIANHLIRIEKIFPPDGTRPRYKLYYEGANGQETYQMADHIVRSTGYEPEVPTLLSEFGNEPRLATIEGNWSHYRPHPELPATTELGYQLQSDGQPHQIYVLKTSVGGRLPVSPGELALIHGSFVNAIGPRSSAFGAQLGNASRPATDPSPRTLLQPSPYEQFHTRAPLRPGAASSSVASMLQARIRLARALRTFALPSGASPEIVLDVDSGSLAIEVRGLARLSARALAAQLNADPAIHEVMSALATSGTGRVRVGIPASAGGAIRADTLDVDFSTGGAPPSTARTFPNGTAYTEYEYHRGAQNNQGYRELVDNSVEVIYMPKGVWGHLSLRVGTRYYSYGQVGSFVNREFAPFPGARGFGFRVPAEQVRELQEALQTITANGSRFNVPPYDIYSVELELVREPSGQLRYRSAAPETMVNGDAIIRNNEPVNARIVEVGAQTFLETPTGFRYPVQRRGGRMYVEPLNCVGSVRMALARVGINLNISPQFGTSVTAAVDATLGRGNAGGTAPNFVVDYSPLVPGGR